MSTTDEELPDVQWNNGNAEQAMAAYMRARSRYMSKIGGTAAYHLAIRMLKNANIALR